jgi:hypothetical protein
MWRAPGLRAARAAAGRPSELLWTAYAAMLLAAFWEDVMAITIRNKALEAEIKAIGARLNKGPTDVLKQLLADHAAISAERERLKREALIAQRKAAMEELLAEARLVTDEQRAAARQAERDMYDDNGLPVH